MSLYNLIFGRNPFSGFLLEVLGTTVDRVPRFRDCFLNEDGSRIIIYTRTGGGNRDFYEHPDRCRENYPEYFGGEDEPSGPWNSDLRALPGFVYDADDEFDGTYASFHYNVPEAFKKMVAALTNIGAAGNPAERWQEMLDGLSSGNTDSPDVKRALEVGQRILGQIKEATDV